MNFCILSHEFPEMTIYSMAEFEVIFLSSKGNTILLKLFDLEIPSLLYGTQQWSKNTKQKKNE